LPCAGSVRGPVEVLVEVCDAYEEGLFRFLKSDA